MKITATVSYRDFGAVGDGVTNDFFAIKAAHDYANANGLPVVAHGGDVYYIRDTRDESGEAQSVTVKTDVDWNGASFIIDDTDFIHFDGTGVTSKDIFVIEPSIANLTVEDREILSEVESKGLNNKSKTLNIPGVDYPAMIIPYSSKNRVYRRRGFGSHLGGLTHETIVIDERGNINPETPVLFDYGQIDYVKIINLTEKPLTVKNGTFTTRASHIDILERDGNGNVIRSRNGYINRGIKILRSFTTVKNVKHYVTGEITLAEQASGILGPTYNGFFSVRYAHSVTVDTCVLTAKRCFRKNNVPGAGSGTSGSYDYTGDDCNKLVFKNCTQSNFWITINMETGETKPATKDTPGAVHSLRQTTYGGINFAVYWGLGGVNYTKNLEFIGSTLSRFDAHAGLVNGKIVDSTYNLISIVGAGHMLIENSTWVGEGIGYGDALFGMREDYGSPWDGTVTVRNVDAYILTDRPSFLVRHGYSNWYCGYQSCFPNIEVENLRYFDQKTGKPLPEGYEINLTRPTLRDEPAIHLDTTKNSHPCYAKVDLDGDGFVDGTDLVFDGVEDNKGIIHEGSYKNENPIRPPKFIKIIQNGKKYTFLVPDTSDMDISDGKYYDDADSNGGFFGDTKFYYGVDEGDFYLGTDHTDTETFKFV